MTSQSLQFIHSYLMGLLDAEARRNMGKDGHPIDQEKNEALEACADYINSLEP